MYADDDDHCDAFLIDGHLEEMSHMCHNMSRHLKIKKKNHLIVRMHLHFKSGKLTYTKVNHPQMESKFSQNLWHLTFLPK